MAKITHRTVCLLAVFAVAFAGVPVGVIAAETPLTIGNISVITTDRVTTISWTTNRTATGELSYGVSDQYATTAPAVTTHDTTHTVTISGLTGDTVYHYRLTARSASQAVSTFDRTFETDDVDDNVAPTITAVTVPYVTGTTVTIQWTTDEPASGRVRWGKTETYGATSSAARSTVHDVTLRGLETSNTYHYRVEATDPDGNVATYHDATVRTADTKVAENAVLAISELTPVSPNDRLLRATAAAVTWRTNKLADGVVQYGTATRLGRTVKVPGARDFAHAVTLTGLTAETTYYFRVVSKDIFGKTVRSDIASVTTRESDGGGPASGSPAVGSATDDSPDAGEVLGSTTVDCSPSLRDVEGLWGQYSNLVPGQDEIRLLAKTPITGKTEADIRATTGWYQPAYQSFTRVDPSLNFPSKFRPVNEGKEQDPHYFAVRWRAFFTLATATPSFSLGLTSDDDSWAFVDWQMAVNNGGRHSARAARGALPLAAGDHELVVLYADRHPYGSSIVLTSPPGVTLHPLPDGCGLDQLGNLRPAAPTAASPSTGAVLGTTLPRRELYTRADALLREAGTRDVYAILYGRKHLISGPTSFAEYGYRVSQIRVVPVGTLERYPDAKLVRLPEGPIYYLYTRPDVRWRKLALPSPTAFVSYPQNRWGDVVVINRYDLDSYPTARLVRTPDDPRVYLLTDRGKRLIPSEEAFLAAGYRWADIVLVSGTHLNSYATLDAMDSGNIAAATQ